MVDARRTLRVLAADDSAVMREILRMVFALHASAGDAGMPRMELVGVAKDGIEALELVRTLRPDLLLLDVEMPRLGGLGVLEQLRSSAPMLPVIMCSAHTERGARVTLDALTHGAKDYVMKPGQQSDFAAALDVLMCQLLPKIAALCGGSGGGVSQPGAPPARESFAGAKPAAMPALPAGATSPVELIVIGVSTGGPTALEQMLPQLPRSLPVPVLIVQHMPKLFTGALAARLHRACQMPVLQARDGMEVQAGTVLLAPGDAHMEIARGAGRTRAVRLHHSVPLNSCKPSVDYLFGSAARLCGAGTLAVVMTGMGQDGLDGSRAVREVGGTVLAQDEASSAVWGMPGRVVRDDVASAQVSLGGMAEALVRRVEAGIPAWRADGAAQRPAAGSSSGKPLRTRLLPARQQGLEDKYGMYR